MHHLCLLGDDLIARLATALPAAEVVIAIGCPAEFPFDLLSIGTVASESDPVADDLDLIEKPAGLTLIDALLAKIAAFQHRVRTPFDHQAPIPMVA
ncbi:hypothetical protein CCR95_01790 [Thiocystis minor]|nr:hypothetical protein [Thiocystis minor]